MHCSRRVKLFPANSLRKSPKWSPVFKKVAQKVARRQSPIVGCQRLPKVAHLALFSPNLATCWPVSIPLYISDAVTPWRDSSRHWLRFDTYQLRCTKDKDQRQSILCRWILYLEPICLVHEIDWLYCKRCIKSPILNTPMSQLQFV